MLKRHHAPVALVVTALGTIILSIIVSIASGDYYDGLSVPFISYVGRDEPSYYVFAIGMSLSGAGVAVVAVLERAWIVRARRYLGLQPTCATHVLVVIMVIAGVNLAVMAITDHRRYWSVHMPAQAGIIVHQLTTIAMYLGSLVAIIMTQWQCSALCRAAEAADAPSASKALAPALYRSLKAKRIASTFLALSTVMHVPTGYLYRPLACGYTPPRLTRAECEESFAAEYCAAWADEVNASLTRFVDHSAEGRCPPKAVAEYNAVTQFLNIALLLCCIGTMAIDLAIEIPAGVEYSVPVPSPAKSPARNAV